MTRKKKKKGTSEELLPGDEAGGDTFAPKGIIHGDVKRSIVGIFFLVLGVLFILGFFGIAGIFGGWLDDISKLSFGWGKWVFPLLFFLFAWFLLRRWTVSGAGSIRFGGYTLVFLSALGFVHLLYGDDTGVLAQLGGGGGFIGFWLAQFFESFVGFVGGVFLFLFLFGVGVMVALNVSLFSLKRAFDTQFRKKEVSDAEINPITTVVTDAASTENVVEDVVPMGMDIHPTEDVVQKHEPMAISDEMGAEELAELKQLEKSNIKRIKSIRAFGENVLNEHGFSAKSDFVEEMPKSIDFINSVELKEDVVSGSKSKSDRRVRQSWKLPSADLLELSKSEEGFGGDTLGRAEVIRKTLANFGVSVSYEDSKVGPTVTQFMFTPASGVKVSRITTLSNDLALALGARSIRIEAPIPGKKCIGIEVPNEVLATVKLRNILESQSFIQRKSPLCVCFGKDVRGEYVVEDIAKMPHLLVAGTTRSGKSVFVNALILSLLYSNSPKDLQLILIDPKRVELSLYNGIPHLIANVITETKKVVNALRLMVGEMDRRYKILEEVGSRDIESFHQRCDRGEKREMKLPDGSTREEALSRLPYIVIVIDEMADLMMSHGREVEGLIVRLAQMARAVGIHLVLATQRPSVEVITGLIKANIANRVAFQVASQIDSRTILDQGGAEKLLGSGDMLFMSPGFSQPRRMQGPYVTEDEVCSVVNFLRQQKNSIGYEESLPMGITMDKSRGPEKMVELPESARSDGNLEAVEVGPDIHHSETQFGDAMVFSLDDIEESSEASSDPRYEEAKQLILEMRQASTSFLQRRLGFGYSRAARIMDQLEKDGVIGPKDGAKPREIFGAKPDIGSNSPVTTAREKSPIAEASLEAEIDSVKDDKWQI